MAKRLQAGRPSAGRRTSTLQDLADEKLTKRLNAEIPAELHKRVRMQAIEDEITITELVTVALQQYLK